MDIVAGQRVLGAGVVSRATLAGVAVAEGRESVAVATRAAGMASDELAVVARTTAGPGRLPGCCRCS